ncbi:MAG: hypothetical protein R3C03_13040 [Pirellulaceae bacterium]
MKQLTSEQRLRFARNFWQLEESDLTDIPIESQTRLLSEVTKATERVWDKPFSQTTNVSDLPSRRSLVMRRIVMTVGVALVLTSAFFYLERTFAINSRQLRKSQLTDAMASDLIQIFEEDTRRTIDLLDSIDQTMTDFPAKPNEPDMATLEACRQAVRCLLATRLGHPSDSCCSVKVERKWTTSCSSRFYHAGTYGKHRYSQSRTGIQ